MDRPHYGRASPADFLDRRDPVSLACLPPADHIVDPSCPLHPEDLVVRQACSKEGSLVIGTMSTKLGLPGQEHDSGA